MKEPTLQIKNRRQTDRRASVGLFSRLLQFVLDMHSGESNVSWTRWMSTLVIGNIMLVWTLNCILSDELKIAFTFEDMPYGLAGVIATMMLGKIGQSGVQAIVDRKEKRDWRNKEV